MMCLVLRVGSCFLWSTMDQGAAGFGWYGLHLRL